MKPLKLKPVPVHREILFSFVSRIAAMNHVDLIDFCVDMGFSIKRLINPDAQVLEIISLIGGLDAKSILALQSWTAEKTNDIRMRFRNEEFVSRALKSPKVRGCPICLKEDTEITLGEPSELMAMRGDWQLREVSICVRHEHPLIPLWERNTPTQRYNIGARLHQISENLLDGILEQPLTPPNAYDLWLDERLEDGNDKTWLADHSLYAATTFCRLLGAELVRLRGDKFDSKTARFRAAQKVGFDVVVKGPKAIKEALDELAAQASSEGQLPNKAYGTLFRDLSQAYLNVKEFDFFRHLLWERIVAIWPVAANQDILGHSLPERRLHSLKTAANEVGVGEFLLDQILVEAGAYARTATRKTFNAIKYADLIAEVPKLVGPIEMRNAMGATRKQFVSLAADKILLPATHITTIKSPWRLEDGRNLVRELNEKVHQTATGHGPWESIQNAKVRTKLSVGFIISAIRDGHLQVSKFEGLVGYRSFCVSKAEMDKLAAKIIQEAGPDVQSSDRAVCTAAAFGRSVGMRENEAFLRLVRGGHTPASQITTSKAGQQRFYLTQDDIAAFHERFVTQNTLATKYSTFWRTIISQLKSEGIAPFTFKGEEYGHLYLRAHAEEFLQTKYAQTKLSDHKVHNH